MNKKLKVISIVVIIFAIVISLTSSCFAVEDNKVNFNFSYNDKEYSVVVDGSVGYNNYIVFNRTDFDGGWHTYMILTANDDFFYFDEGKILSPAFDGYRVEVYRYNNDLDVFEGHGSATSSPGGAEFA